MEGVSTPKPPARKDGKGGGGGGDGLCALFSPLALLFSPAGSSSSSSSTSGLTDGPDGTAAADDGPSEESMTAALVNVAEPLGNDDFLSTFEKLLDRFGVETVLFLKVHRASRWFKISGKRSSMRSKMSFTGLEFRIRSTAEMKKLRFDWKEVTGAETSELSPHFIVPSKFKVLPGETIDNCFLKVSTTLKGEFHCAFKSTALRDAVLRGFSLVIRNRPTPATHPNPAAAAVSTTPSNPTTTTGARPRHGQVDDGNDDDDDDDDDAVFDEIADDNEMNELSPYTPRPPPALPPSKNTLD